MWQSKAKAAEAKYVMANVDILAELKQARGSIKVFGFGMKLKISIEDRKYDELNSMLNFLASAKKLTFIE